MSCDVLISLMEEQQLQRDVSQVLIFLLSLTVMVQLTMCLCSGEVRRHSLANFRDFCNWSPGHFDQRWIVAIFRCSTDGAPMELPLKNDSNSWS